VDEALTANIVISVSISSFLDFLFPLRNFSILSATPVTD
jgi:hypothetical protein